MHAGVYAVRSPCDAISVSSSMPSRCTPVLGLVHLAVRQGIAPFSIQSRVCAVWCHERTCFAKRRARLLSLPCGCLPMRTAYHTRTDGRHGIPADLLASLPRLVLSPATKKGRSIASYSLSHEITLGRLGARPSASARCGICEIRRLIKHRNSIPLRIAASSGF